MYGLTDEYEMLAEMANPAFRRALKGKRLWRQLVNGIKKLFGIDVTDSGEGATTAFDVLNKAIETILDNFDPVEYANYRSNPYSEEHEMNLFDLDAAEKPRERQQWVQKSLFDETQPAAKASPSKREEKASPEDKQTEEENEGASAANRAIDEYAERFAEIWGQYEAFIEARAEMADDLAERLEGELQLLGAILEGELAKYYRSEGNSDEDAGRMARDKAGLVRAEITLAMNKPRLLADILERESGAKGSSTEKPATTPEEKQTASPVDKPADAKKKTPKKSTYRSAAGDVLQWQSEGRGLKTLAEGEFAYIERQFAEDGMFPFLTGAGKIKTDADVAYLFRCLENSAIENTFAVLVGKDGRPLIVHIGMGTAVSSMADSAAIRAAMDAYEATKVYFVHNHPSGNLQESPQDRQLYAKIVEMVGADKMGGAIIIDVTSGKYSIFDVATRVESREMPTSVKGKEREHGVLAFSRQAFAADYNPENLTQVKGPDDIAAFVTSRRLGEGVKVGYLLLSRAGKIIGNMQSTHTDYSDARGLGDEIARQATAHGASGVILYGNARFDRSSLSRLRGELEKKSARGINILDAMRIDNGLSRGWESALDSGVMEAYTEYGEADIDKAYLEAIESGDMETASAMVRKAAREAGYFDESPYQGTSAFNGAAPSNAYGWSKQERKEKWETGEFEGDYTLGDHIDFMGEAGDQLDFLINDPNGFASSSSMGRESIQAIREAIRRGDRKITVYRSVPSEVKEGSLRDGDWVTPSRSYAKDNAALHGWGRKYRIIEQSVDFDDLWWDGNDINEWGFDRGANTGYKNTRNNRKLLDAVTYDDNGEVIPLSKRFDERKGDERYREGDGAYSDEELSNINDPWYKASWGGGKPEQEAAGALCRADASGDERQDCLARRAYESPRGCGDHRGLFGT